MKKLKDEKKDSMSKDVSLSSEFNTLVQKFNKYRKVETTSKEDTKALARKMKNLQARIDSIASKLTKPGEKNKKKSALHHNNNIS